ncbi:MAG: hypothetical protein AAF843_21470, partial [Bacteroidota bacterium]
IDPKTSERESPYVGFGNRPNFFIDPLGDTVRLLTQNDPRANDGATYITDNVTVTAEPLSEESEGGSDQKAGEVLVSESGSGAMESEATAEVITGEINTDGVGNLGGSTSSSSGNFATAIANALSKITGLMSESSEATTPTESVEPEPTPIDTVQYQERYKYTTGEGANIRSHIGKMNINYIILDNGDSIRKYDHELEKK